jgi:hypothetical protein
MAVCLWYLGPLAVGSDFAESLGRIHTIGMVAGQRDQDCGHPNQHQTAFFATSSWYHFRHEIGVSPAVVPLERTTTLWLNLSGRNTTSVNLHRDKASFGFQSTFNRHDRTWFWSTEDDAASSRRHCVTVVVAVD